MAPLEWMKGSKGVIAELPAAADAAPPPDRFILDVEVEVEIAGD